MRTTCSRSNTKILPSPILPVFADFSTASITCSSSSVLIAASIFTLGRKSTTYSAPRYNSVWPFCRPKPLTSVTVIPCTPIVDSASRTSSSLNGLMIAVTSFILFSWSRRAVPAGPKALSERLADRKQQGCFPGVFRLRVAGIAKAIELCRRRALTFRVRVQIRGTKHPAVDVFRHADFPIGVVGVVHALELQVADVTVRAPAVAQIVVAGQVHVIRILGSRGTEVVIDRVKKLER